MVSHPAWGVWIETKVLTDDHINCASHPAWGVWIETTIRLNAPRSKRVTPRMGCVD